MTELITGIDTSNYVLATAITHVLPSLSNVVTALVCLAAGIKLAERAASWKGAL